MSQKAPRQLILDLVQEPKLGRDDFCVSPANADALALVDAWPRWPGKVLVLAGPEGAGKSHLARIWAGIAKAGFLAGRSLTAASIPAFAACPAMVVEDADRLDGQEAQLFHLMNLLGESGGWLLLTARLRPDLWGLRIPDLVSRLRLAPCVEMAAPDDPLLRMVLAKHLADRQLVIEPAVIDFIVLRMERSLAAASALAAALDAEALEKSRPVTRKLAADVLARLQGGQQEIDFG